MREQRMEKFKEVWEELKSVFSGKGVQIVDSILPLVVFLILNQFTTWQTALYSTLAFNMILLLMRFFQGKKITYALAGIGGVAAAAFFAQLSGSQAGYFIPGLISGGITVSACLVSVLIKRPLAAWSSFITRRWKLDWYWHPRILPAYSEVTLFWALAFAARLGLEYILYQQDAINTLGIVRILLGWPYTILLLIISYLYGLWRLRQLQGPSVDEFKAGKEAPWQGQKRGF